MGVGLSGTVRAGGCRYYAALMIYPDKFPNEEYLRILTEVRQPVDLRAFPPRACLCACCLDRR